VQTGNATSSCKTGGGDIVIVQGAGFESTTAKVWVGTIPVRTFTVTADGRAIAFSLPPAPSSQWNRYLAVQVESRNLNSSSSPLLVMYGSSPSAPSASSQSTRWGLTIDEFVVVIVALVVVVGLLLLFQLLWCLSRFANIRCACVQRLCPRLVAGHGQPKRDEEADGIRMNLLGNDRQGGEAELAAAAAYRQPVGPYMPAAAAAYAPPAPPMPAQYLAPQYVAAPYLATSMGVEGIPQQQQQPYLLPRSFVPSPQYYQ
jgi:hypothetical protein